MYLCHRNQPPTNAQDTPMTPPTTDPAMIGALEWYGGNSVSVTVGVTVIDSVVEALPVNDRVCVCEMVTEWVGVGPLDGVYEPVSDMVGVPDTGGVGDGVGD